MSTYKNIRPVDSVRLNSVFGAWSFFPNLSQPHVAVISKPERHFSIRDVAALLSQAALLQPFLFSRCKLPVRASDQRGNEGLFKLHRPCPLKLRRLFLFPAI